MADFPLTLISASAGSGKTTILSEWVSSTAHPVAWVSLDANDNDPAQFLTYLIEALRTVQGSFGQDVLESLRSDQSELLDSNLIKLINELAEFPEDTFLLIDDYHLITEQVVHDIVTFLIERLPPRIHLVFASRVDPPWPLSRYRARHQVYELRGKDLRFNTQEIQTFLTRAVGSAFPAEDVRALEERTEGWVAGLQLAALSMQGSSDPSEFIRDFTGSHLYVAEYLIEEILHNQPAKVRSFLLATSILERLNGDLCQTVSECADGKTILDGLYRANNFIIPLDNQGQWFRYHHLFADLLQSRLQQTCSPQVIAAYHLRAAEWFDQNGFYIEAVHHALAARQDEKAAALIARYGQQVFYAGRYSTLRRWLNAIPADYFPLYPRLEIYQLLLDLLEGTLDMYEDTLVEKEKLIKALPSSPENDRLRQRALVDLSLFLAFQNPGKAIQIAEETLAEIPKEDLAMRATLYSVFFRAYGMKGDHEKSSAAYRESFRLAEITGQYDLISNTTKVRALELCYYGQLDEAISYCQRLIDAGQQSGKKEFFPAGPCYIGLAAIYLERNDLAKAEELLALGLSLSEKGALYGLFNGHVLKVRLLQAQGRLAEALKALQILEQSFSRREFSLIAQKVSLFLAAGEMTAASELVPDLVEILGASHYARKLPLLASEAFKLCLARIYLAQGQIEKADQMLTEVEATVEPGLRFGRLMEAYILRAKARNSPSMGAVPPQAVDYLARAVELAIEPGFMTLFLEEGPELVPILAAVADHDKSSEKVRNYARGLLQAFAARGQELPGQEIPASDQLREQLTPRELEVLELMGAGATNQEIAEKLVVTVRTVKKHASNIYGKLGVSSRTQAVIHAQQIGLLSSD